jgi:hypothetical protein
MADLPYTANRSRTAISGYAVADPTTTVQDIPASKGYTTPAPLFTQDGKAVVIRLKTQIIVTNIVYYHAPLALSVSPATPIAVNLASASPIVVCARGE